MTRLIEILLLLTPLAAYLLWRQLVRRGIPNPSRHTLIALAAALVLFGATMVFMGLHEREPAGSRYVPAQLENGRIVPGHAAGRGA